MVPGGASEGSLALSTTALSEQAGLGKEYAEYLDYMNAADALPFHVSAPITVKPTVMNFPIAPGWVQSALSVNAPPFCDSMAVEKYLMKQNDKGKELWSVGGSLVMKFQPWSQEQADSYKKIVEGGTEENCMVGSYYGKIIAGKGPYNLRDKSYTYHGLLRDGDAGLEIIYVCNGKCAEGSEEELSSQLQFLLDDINNMRMAFTTTVMQ